MKKLALILFLTFLACGLLSQSSQAQVSKHALARVARVAVAPVAHPKRSLKVTAGSVVFMAEDVVDVVHISFAALDALTGSDLDPGAQRIFFPVHAVFHAGDVIFTKADSGLESAESFFFGSSN